jgi:hypothetical protein
VTKYTKDKRNKEKEMESTLLSTLKKEKDFGG